MIFFNIIKNNNSQNLIAKGVLKKHKFVLIIVANIIFVFKRILKKKKNEINLIWHEIMLHDTEFEQHNLHFSSN